MLEQLKIVVLVYIALFGALTGGLIIMAMTIDAFFEWDPLVEVMFRLSAVMINIFWLLGFGWLCVYLLGN